MFFNNLLITNEEKNKISVLFWLNNSKKSVRTGLIPLYCRITLNGKRATESGFSTNVSIKSKDDWNNKLQIITVQTEEAQLQNERLQRIKIDIMQTFAIFELSNKPFTALDIHQEYTGKTPIQVVQRLGNLIEKWQEVFRKKVEINDKSPLTLESCENYNSKINVYFGKDKPLNTFTESMYEDFRLHLRTFVITRGKNKGKCLHINTVAKALGQLSTLFKYAYQLRWLPTNLYEAFEAPRIKSEKLALTTEQLQKLWDLETKNTSLREAVDIFLFLASTGFSYSDYCQLDADNFITHENGRKYIVKEYREKSPTLERYGKSIVPIFARAEVFLDKYNNNPKEFPRPDSHDVNDALKIAWEIIGVRNDMALKNARHTFINYVRKALGLPEGAIATIVGHASVCTTEDSYLIRDIEIVEQDLKRANL